MNFDRLALCLLILYLLYLLYQQHRFRLRRLLQRSKDRLPRTWKPKSARDCACCQTGITLVPLPDPNTVVPWSEYKSTRGRKKTLDTSGYACPHSGCDLYWLLSSSARLSCAKFNQKRCHTGKSISYWETNPACSYTSFSRIPIICDKSLAVISSSARSAIIF